MKISIKQLRKIIAEETTKLARLNEAPRRTQPTLVLPPISSTWRTTSNLTSPEAQLIYADATSQIKESDWENLFKFLLSLKSTGKRPQDPTKNYNGRPLSGSALISSILDFLVVNRMSLPLSISSALTTLTDQAFYNTDAQSALDQLAQNIANTAITLP